MEVTYWFVSVGSVNNLRLTGPLGASITVRTVVRVGPMRPFLIPLNPQQSQPSSFTFSTALDVS
eukprot:GDKH01026317.1.p3 GENE.GDKH01026317.1~~GDKH01026317.1.p3  ORF type:complete len:64 (-),score=2.07 GDKH01026317.1:51-242(-)